MTQDTSCSVYFSRFKFTLYSNWIFQLITYFRYHVTDYCHWYALHGAGWQTALSRGGHSQYAPYLELRLGSQSVTVQNCPWLHDQNWWWLRDHTAKLPVTRGKNLQWLCDFVVEYGKIQATPTSAIYRVTIPGRSSKHGTFGLVYGHVPDPFPPCGTGFAHARLSANNHSNKQFWHTPPYLIDCRGLHKFRWYVFQTFYCLAQGKPTTWVLLQFKLTVTSHFADSLPDTPCTRSLEIIRVSSSTHVLPFTTHAQLHRHFCEVKMADANVQEVSWQQQNQEQQQSQIPWASHAAVRASKMM